MAEAAKKIENHKNALERWRHIFADELKQTDEVIMNMTSGKAKLIPELVGHLITSGGKRLRPILTIISAKLCGYEGDRHIKLAAAIELLHTATLLHDDVVDESDLRRGRKTANSIWGNEASVLVGDFLLACAFRLMAHDGSIRVLEMLSDTSAIITEGEIKQLMAINDIKTGEERYLDIISDKTAQLFAAACSVGSIVAEKSSEEEKALNKFGMNLGIAFQIVDDALDYSAKQEELGKTVGDDFREGKLTMPVILSYQNGNKEEKHFWERTIEENIQEESDLAQAIEIISRQGVLKQTMQKAKEYAQKASFSLKDFPESQEKSALMDLAEFAVSRPY